MNKTSKTANFLKYLKTFILTALFVLISVLIIFGFINYQVYNEMTSKSVKEDTIDYYLVSVLIDKNKYLEENNPDDYRINLKLAILYEIQGDLKTSEAQYKIAISKAPFNEFKPEYRLASLYLIEDRLDDAQKVMDDIDERPDKKLISYKGEIYARIGDKYYNKGDYEEAGFKYQKSLYYFKVIDSKRIKDVEKSLVSSYVYLAEQNVRELNPVEAVKLLKMAMTIVDAPIIKYKLALLVMDTNPEQASAYFDEVFKREPNIINYEVYYNYLQTLIKIANENGEYAVAELYKYRQKKIEEYYQSNILSINDVKINEIKGKIKLDWWKKKYSINLNLRLKNNSGYAIKFLKILVVFKDGDEIIDTYSNEIANDKYTLRKDTIGPLLNIKVFKTKDANDKPPKEITASIYVFKVDEAYKLHLKDFVIKEKVKRTKPKFKLFFLEF